MQEWNGRGMVQAGITVCGFVNDCYVLCYSTNAHRLNQFRRSVSDDSDRDESPWQTVNLPVHLF